MAQRARRRDPAAALIVSLLGVVPVLFVGSYVVRWIFSNDRGVDLRVSYLRAAHLVVHGASPYPSIGGAELAHGEAYVYPPLVAFATIPLTALPEVVTVSLGLVLAAIMPLLILALVGVRDWRCYGVALVWAPTLNSIETLNISAFLAVLLACAWRMREARCATSGASLGAIVAAKAFLCPLLVWPVAMARRRASAVAVAVAAVLILAPWAAIGFAGFTSYPSLIRALTAREEPLSYSIAAGLESLGIPGAGGRAVSLTIAVGLLAAAITFARNGDDVRSFVAAVMASLAATPILWQHYLQLLLVAVAVARPRLSPVWFAPLVIWAAPRNGNGAVWQTLLVPVVAAVVGAACLRQRRVVTPLPTSA